MPVRGVVFLQLLGRGEVVFSPHELFFSRAAEFALFAQKVLRHASTPAKRLPTPVKEGTEQ
jgi:hypothetical protein